jgi:hypothetical protein
MFSISCLVGVSLAGEFGQRFLYDRIPRVVSVGGFLQDFMPGLFGSGALSRQCSALGLLLEGQERTGSTDTHGVRRFSAAHHSEKVFLGA